MLKIGDYELHSVQTGTLRLDGGAMFGIVPKVLWQKSADVDEDNRILLATRTLLAVNRAEKRVILVDTGCGSKWAPGDAERFEIRHRTEAIPDALASLGLTINEVTDVIITHLHFDHNGGLTDWFDEPGERTTLCFPRARHWVHKKHWEHACCPHAKDKASFLQQDFEALEKSGGLELLEGDSPDLGIKGVSLFTSQGHTPYQIHPFFQGDDARLLFVGDIIPTVAHLRQAWVMAYDVLPMTTMAEKLFFARSAIEEGWLLAFPHDPQTAVVALDGLPERPIVSRTV